MNNPLQYADLEFENGQLTKIKNIPVCDISEADMAKYTCEIAQIAFRMRLPTTHRFFKPVVIPVDKYDRGPVTFVMTDKLVWEVWDQFATSYGTFMFIDEAIALAEQLNDKYGQCIDEGCPNYGSPHQHVHKKPE